MSSTRGRWRARATGALLVLACLLPPLLVKQIPVFDGLERLLHDAYRYVLARRVPLDPDIALLYYNDTVARDAAKTSPVDRVMLAQAIAAADKAGAKAIAVDFFFAQPTPDEDALIAALHEVRTPTYLIYADPEADGGVYWSAPIATEARAYQDRFWQRIANPLVRPISPMIGTDDANVARRWPARGPKSHTPMSAAMAALGPQDAHYAGSIAFDRPAAAAADGAPAALFPSYSLSSVTNPLLAQSFAPQLRGRYILIGLDIFNADRFATPITRITGEKEIPGVAVHAQMLRQALNRDFPPPLPAPLAVLIAAAMTLLGAATARVDRHIVLVGMLIAAGLAASALLPILLFFAGYDLLSLPVSGWFLSWAIALAGFGYLARLRTSAERSFARSALGKYLPAAVAQEILEDPAKLSLEGEERRLFMLFTDLEGFTRISHSQPPATTARILNRYLDEMSEIVLAHAGTIDKFVGDAIVAFWGAPLASDRDPANAVACALALHACSERLRAELAAEGEQLGRTRIGLHCGPVVVGNFGGRQRIQYTALGDAMNTAARLEGANKYLASAILVSGEVRDAAPGFAYLPLGKIVMSGVDTPIAVFEPVPEEARDVALLVARALNGDPLARTQLAAHADAFPAIASLLARWDIATKEEAYVLGSK